MAKERFDVHQVVTDQIVAAIEAGAGQTSMPWWVGGSAVTRPKNVASGKVYRGINTIALWAAAATKGYSSGLWGTFNQWKELGAQVRKGEKSSVIIFYTQFDSDDDDEEKKKRFMIRAFRVFNVAQVDEYEFPEDEQVPEVDLIDPIEEVDDFVKATGAKINEGGERAFYSQTKDDITMPDRSRFLDTEAWYSVLLHELVHWSGAENRLERVFGKKFGDQAYAAGIEATLDAFAEHLETHADLDALLDIARGGG